MTLASIASLFVTLLVLAITPGIGQLVVAGRTLAYGLRAGLITSLGIGSGDVIYIALVCFGLASLHELFEQILIPVKYLGAAYLLWLAFGLIRPSQKTDSQIQVGKRSSHFLWGLAVTLGNPKVILFYLGLLPALVDIPSLRASDVLVISLTAVVAVSGVMSAFAWMTQAAKKEIGEGVTHFDRPWLSYAGAVLLAGFALYLLWDLSV